MENFCLVEVILQYLYERTELLDGYLYKVDGHVFDDLVVIGLTIDVILKILIIIFTEQLQKSKDSLYDFISLRSLQRSFFLIRIFIVSAILIIELDSDHIALKNQSYVLEYNVLMILFKDVEKLCLRVFVSSLEELVGEGK